MAGNEARAQRTRIGLVALVALPLLVVGWSFGCTPARGDTWVDESWSAYVARYIQEDGRVIDPFVEPGQSTSEGQSYAMVRALWMEDRDVFERTWAWARANLQREGSELLAWKWGQRSDGKWGVIDPNSASDADVHCAYALAAAGQLWNEPAHTAAAAALAKAIWEEEVLTLDGQPILLPGNWAKSENPVPINPSYLLPPFFRRIAAVDPEHDWIGMAQAAYSVLDFGLEGTGLPPDWIFYQRQSGELVAGDETQSLPGRFGPDAYRVFWNLALDHAWDRSPEALRWMRGRRWIVDFLALNGTLPREVSPQALPRVTGPEPLALHGALYPFLVRLHRDQSLKTLDYLRESYSEGIWGDPKNYYVQNLAWFGVALAEGRIKPILEVPTIED